MNVIKCRICDRPFAQWEGVDAHERLRHPQAIASLIRKKLATPIKKPQSRDKETERLRGQRYYNTHKEQIKAKDHEYYLKNWEKVNTRNKAYKKSHPEVLQKCNANLCVKMKELRAAMRVVA